MSVRATKWAKDLCLKHSDLTRSQRLVLLCLATHHNHKTGECFPEVATIASFAGLCLRRAQYAVRVLEKRGAISVTARFFRGSQTSNGYELFGELGAASSPRPERNRGAKGGRAPARHRSTLAASYREDNLKGLGDLSDGSDC